MGNKTSYNDVWTTRKSEVTNLLRGYKGTVPRKPMLEATVLGTIMPLISATLYNMAPYH